MLRLERSEILDAFPRAHRKLVVLPRDLDDADWPSLDFLGWVDIGTARGFMVAEHRGTIRGLAFGRDPVPAGQPRAKMCSLCKTIHGTQGVKMFTTTHPRNRELRLGDYFCDDLRCSLRVRRLIALPPNQMQETIGADEKALRLALGVESFFDRCYD